ncbi:glycoprotein precursor [Yaba-7 virus]|uniref:Envelopment polyprotein n=1 Tax=Yaba-7 virus TaxID=159137 RepID=A0A346JF11_9VIRU|nr:glycoprotein precursor [Yaba-7 virus]AXP32086.1 glycoprotein precursor [Yaba-7 virus]
MIITMFYIIAIAAIASAMPPRNTNGGRCFYGGTIFRQVNSTSPMSEICVRDDISLIKSIGYHSLSSNKQEIEASMSYYRLYYVKDWFDCNPVQDTLGTFTVFDIDNEGLLSPKTYACRANCVINLERETGSVVLDSAALNHYTIHGTTIKSGWFKTRVAIDLENTCEDIHVTCGHKTLNVHACFRQHKSCIRYFKGSILPEIMIESICTNAELILLCCFSAIACLVAMILTKTYLVYLLIPIFYPLVKIYGIILERFFKQCKNCLLPIHPFTPCPTICICGMVYNSTEALKVHRKCLNCSGYKTLTKTRYLCKKKLPNMTLAVIITVLFFTFITPITAECYNYTELPTDFQNALDSNNACVKEQLIMVMLTVLCILVVSLVIISANIYIRLYYTFCAYCGMVHEKRGLILLENFTSHCLTCICQDKSIHRASNNCITPIKYKNSKFANALCIGFLILIAITPAFTSCITEKDIESIDEASMCIGLYQNVTKAKDYDIFTRELAANMSSHEIEVLLPSTKPTFDQLVKKSGSSTDLHAATIYELIAAHLYPESFKRHLQSAGPGSVQWRAYIQNNNLHLCNEHVVKKICRCVIRQEDCASTKYDDGDQIANYYKNNKEYYKADLEILYTTIGRAIPGLTGNLLKHVLKSQKYDEALHVLNKIKRDVEKNNQLNGIVEFLMYINSKNISDEAKELRIIPAVSITGTKFTTKTTGENNIKDCLNPQYVSCTGRRYKSLVKQFISCSNNGVKMYQRPNKPLVLLNNKLCIGDRYCMIAFEPLVVDQNIHRLECFSKSATDQSEGMSRPEKSIRLLKTGECKIGGVVSKIAVSITNKHFKYETITHKKSNLVDEYCLSPTCEIDMYPYYSQNLLECIWNSSSHVIINQRVVSHTDIESFISSIKLAMHNDLIQHHFRPLKNMPHVKPNYKSINIQGTTANGKILDSFITFSIPLMTGLSQGFTLKGPKGYKLFDMVVYIKSARVVAKYAHEYMTGPTVSINTQHTEKCTGSCPANIPKRENWLTFSREHTSSWGCEEWGCLAIGAGCVYGSCQDVIKEEASVLRRISTEAIEVEFCISDPTSTMCNTIDVLEPVLGEHMQFEIHSTQTNLLPEMVLIKNKRAFVGPINRRGVFNPQCGSVQQFDGKLYGVGNPKFDYICHAFARKDIVVRKCYENHYYSCSTLKEAVNLKLNATSSNTLLYDDNVLLGSAAVKIMLGDIVYQESTIAEKSIQGHAVCGGCIDCFNDVACKVSITSNGAFQCSIKSNCESYINNIYIAEGINDINLKFRCTQPEIKIDICGQNIAAKSEIIKDTKKLDLASADQTSYIREFDRKCNTWLCRAYNEGIGFIFKPLWDELGIWGRYILLIGILIVVVLVAVKILKPLIRNIIAMLKENDKVYKLENKIK